MNEPQVLVSFVKTHKTVSSLTVSRWLKILEMAGIDTHIFKGHSTLVALSSEADVYRLSVSDIMKQSHWSWASIFQKISPERYFRTTC